MVIPFIVFISIAPDPLVQIMRGEFVRPLMIDTLQVSEYVSPAMEMPEGSIPTWITSEGTEDTR